MVHVAGRCAVHQQRDVADEVVRLQVLVGRREMDAQGVLPAGSGSGGRNRELIQLQVVVDVVERSIL